MTWYRGAVLLVLTGWLVFLLGTLSCAKAQAPSPPSTPLITAFYLDNGWADSLLVCVQPDLPTFKVGWVCVTLGELRQSLREVRVASR